MAGKIYVTETREYMFPPLTTAVTASFSDGSELRLPRGTCYVACQICDENLLVYPKNREGEGKGEFKLEIGVLGELENKLNSGFF